MTKLSLLSAVGVMVWMGTAPRAARAADDCTLRGSPVLPATLALYDAPEGGQELGHFTGTKVTVTVSRFPDAAGGRAVIETAGFRLKAFVRARDLPVYTARSVPIYAGHVWINEARRVAVIGATRGRLHVEKALSGPMSGYFHGWAPCDALTLDERVPPGWAPPGGARGFVLKQDRVELFAAPRGDVVTTVERAGGSAGVLFWGTDREGAWVHVEHHGDVLLDVWARAQDLDPLPPGETMDQLAPPRTITGSPQLSIQGAAKTVHVDHAVGIRSAATDAATVIGGIDPGTDVLVLDTVAGWASVVPRALTLMPSDAHGFWVRAKELGL